VAFAEGSDEHRRDATAGSEHCFKSFHWATKAPASAINTQHSPGAFTSDFGRWIAPEKAGIEFIDENGGEPAVRLRKRIQKEPESTQPIPPITGCLSLVGPPSLGTVEDLRTARAFHVLIESGGIPLCGVV
jgi:hypothetical protein